MRASELHCRSADAAARAMYEERFAGTCACAHEERAPRGRIRHAKRRALRERHARGKRMRDRFIADHELRVAAGRTLRVDPIPRFEAGDVRTSLLDGSAD